MKSIIQQNSSYLWHKYSSECQTLIKNLGKTQFDLQQVRLLLQISRIFATLGTSEVNVNDGPSNKFSIVGRETPDLENIQSLCLSTIKEIETGKATSESLSQSSDQCRSWAFTIAKELLMERVFAYKTNADLNRVNRIDDYQIRINDEKMLFTNNLRAVERTPVRLDLTHCCWSDLFLVCLNTPRVANVINMSVNLSSIDSLSTPEPPIMVSATLLPNPVLQLAASNIHESKEYSYTGELLEDRNSGLRILEAAIVSAGIVPPQLIKQNVPLQLILEKLIGKRRGLLISTNVKQIPVGSRLAVSTSLACSIITLCLRLTGQLRSIGELLHEDDRLKIASRAMLAEWLIDTCAGWQDATSIWPGIRRLQFPESSSLLPDITLLKCTNKFIDTFAESAILIHAGMSRDAASLVQSVAEQHLLATKRDQVARTEALDIADAMNKVLVRNSSSGEGTNTIVTERSIQRDVRRLAYLTTINCFGPVRNLIPWAVDSFTIKLVSELRRTFHNRFWGFWMMGGMTGGSMVIFVDPRYRRELQARVLDLLDRCRLPFESTILFASKPAAYLFTINSYGTTSHYEEVPQ